MFNPRERRFFITGRCKRKKANSRKKIVSQIMSRLPVRQSRLCALLSSKLTLANNMTACLVHEEKRITGR